MILKNIITNTKQHFSRCSRPEAAFYCMASLLFAFTFFIRFYLIFNRALDSDEFARLHSSWAVSQGQLIYRDFFDNQMVLLEYLLAPLFHFFKHAIQIIYAARLLMFLFCSASFYLTFKIALICFERKTALLSLLLLGYMDIFTQKMIEIRADLLHVPLWLLCLYIFIKTFPSPKGIFFSGLALGIAWLATPKALFAFTGISLTLILCSVFRLSLENMKINIRLYLIFLLGFLIPIFLCFIFFFIQGGLGDLFYSVLFINFTASKEYSPSPWDITNRPEYLGFWRVCIPGLILTAFTIVKNKKNEAVLAPFISCLVLLLIYFYISPGTYEQGTTPFLPLLAIYGGYLLCTTANLVFRNKPNIYIGQKIFSTILLMVFLYTAVIFPASKLKQYFYTDYRKDMQWFIINKSLELSKKEEYIFDGMGRYIMRPHAYFFPSFSIMVAGLHKKGILPEKGEKSFIEEIKAKNVRIIMIDHKLKRALTKDTRDFLYSQYINIDAYNWQPPVHDKRWYSIRKGARDVIIKDGEIRIYGKRWTQDDFTAGDHLYFEILIPGIYTIKTINKHLKLWIDNSPAKKDIHLEEGGHILHYEGSLKEIILHISMKTNDD